MFRSFCSYFACELSALLCGHIQFYIETKKKYTYRAFSSPQLETRKSSDRTHPLAIHWPIYSWEFFYIQLTAISLFRLAYTYLESCQRPAQRSGILARMMSKNRPSSTGPRPESSTTWLDLYEMCLESNIKLGMILIIFFLLISARSIVFAKKKIFYFPVIGM